jgi:hypothetical protein
LLCVIAFIRCSVVRNVKLESPGELSEKTILESAKNQNSTTGNFTVAKADIQIKTSNGTERVVGSFKYENPDKYLISIRSRVGIELVRIFISEDTLLVNDRINRKLYFGSSAYLEKKYNIAFLAMPLIFGDYIIDNKQDNYKSYKKNGKLSQYCILGQRKIQYIIDIKKKKTVSAIILNDSGSTEISINYNGFIKNGANLFPGRIRIEDLKNSLSVDIKIKNVESKLKGKIEFIPGNKYELKRLL